MMRDAVGIAAAGRPAGRPLEEEDGAMAEVSGVLLHHRKRLSEIAGVLVRHGLADWAARGSAIAEVPTVDRLVHRMVPAGDVEASTGERWRGALTELGTTWIKFGQMLS